MKVLITGGTGMLGHQVVKAFAKDPKNEVIYTTRPNSTKNAKFAAGLGKNARNIEVDLLKNQYFLFDDPDTYSDLDVIINCAGLIKPDMANYSNSDFMKMNVSLPLALSIFASGYTASFINISTDCVFCGYPGQINYNELNNGYKENDDVFYGDIYSNSKSCGEDVIDNAHGINIRTSIIGKELTQGDKPRSLLSWYLNELEKAKRIASNGTKINGFENHFWSGLTTNQLAKILVYISDFNFRSYLAEKTYHIFSDRVSKFELLNKINKQFGGEKYLTVEKVKAEEDCDRSLDSIYSLCGKLKIPSIDQQIKEMFEEDFKEDFKEDFEKI